MSKTYTDEELQELLKEFEDKLEAKHFEEATLDFIKETNRRLNEANGYKATIGKDIKTVIARLEAIEARFAAEDIDMEKQTKKRELHKQWYQDWVIRIGIVGTIIWEILNIWQAAGGSVHGIVK